MRTIVSFLLFLGLIAAATYYYLKYYHSGPTASFRTAAVERGDMLPTIGATGTVEPEQVVDIGSQVNGLIMELKADYGSNVDKNTVLATIDETLYKATFDQDEAAVKSAEAYLMQAEANLALAQANLKRDDVLLKKNAIAPADYDTAFAAVEVGKATVGVYKAAINQAKATREQARINLGYCEIKSPVKGTIVDRRVNVGQTVVSSLSASSLFLLAKDLSRIQVWASVNEADIGRIQRGVKVHFTVDAYPNETFYGEVLQVRLNATMTQNVVTYTVVVTTDNKEIALPAGKTPSHDLLGEAGPRYKLLPYMTASLLFEIERHDDVLKVPNAALRWKPRAQQIAPDIRRETLEAMNRREDKAKPTDGKKDDGEKDSAQVADNGQAAGSGKMSPGPSSQDAKPAAAGHDASLATSSGTASGQTPADFKARAEKNAGSKGKSAAPVKAQGPKLAGSDRQPPGRPISAETAAALKEHHESGRLWIADGNFVRPLPVKIIATDGTMTEVRGRDVTEGMEIVVGENVASDNEGDTTNPFMPKLFRGKSKSSATSK